MSGNDRSADNQQQFWQMVLETWAGSGLSVRQFCGREGLSEPSFYYWRKKLSIDENRSGIKERSEAAEFIEVSMPESDQRQSHLELVLTSGNCLHINDGVDGKFLHEVISVLQRSGLC